MSNQPATSSLTGKNQRLCPALGAAISRAECGAQRGSKVSCPPDCAFYPLGLASEEPWNRLNTAWLAKTARFLTAKLGHDEISGLVRRMTITTDDQEYDYGVAFLNTLYYALLVRRDEAGKTCVEQWEAEGWAGLNNDEQVMMRYRRAALPTVLQVRGVLGDRLLRCVDLLAPGSPPFALRSRGAAANLIRYSRVFTWLAHYPYFSRSDALALTIHPVIWPFWRQRIEQQFAQAASTQPGLTLKLFLAENLAACSQLLFDLVHEYADRIDQAKEDLHYCSDPWEWLATPLPALHGLSPIAAALDLAERPQLTTLVELYLGIWEAAHPASADAHDADWILDQLSLPELK